MKLRLTNEHDIAILDVLEGVSVQNVSVLRAGISKLLQSGKNKIVLNLIDAKQLAMDVIREIVKLHLVATELKGEIVLVGQGEMVRQAIGSFSAPPAIKYFNSTEAALSSLLEAAKEAGTAASKAPEPTGSNDDLKSELARLQAVNNSLKGKLSGMNADEVRKLRYENGVFQRQLSAMEAQLQILRKENKPPFSIESVQTKLTQLDETLSELLAKEGLVSAQ